MEVVSNLEFPDPFFSGGWKLNRTCWFLSQATRGLRFILDLIRSWRLVLWTYWPHRDACFYKCVILLRRNSKMDRGNIEGFAGTSYEVWAQDESLQTHPPTPPPSRTYFPSNFKPFQDKPALGNPNLIALISGRRYLQSVIGNSGYNAIWQQL